MMKTFVLGDVHGACRALTQVLERASFDYENDRLICLGDVVDGWPHTKQAIDELLKIKNLIYLLGNHDVWALQWMETREAAEVWLDQGGRATCDSYKEGIPGSHLNFFRQAKYYFVEDNRLFVHAGVLPGMEAEECSDETLLWDRTMVQLARHLNSKDRKITPYDEVFVGHTPISSPHPVQYCEVWMIDTGAAWSGVLSMMNIDTKECFMSDVVKDLYRGIKGR
ncbi:MAG: metallophosphoesterase [Bacteroidota bacterium]